MVFGRLHCYPGSSSSPSCPTAWAFFERGSGLDVFGSGVLGVSGVSRAQNASDEVLTTAMASGYQWIYAVFADADALDALNAKKNAKKRTVQQLVGFQKKQYVLERVDNC